MIRIDLVTGFLGSGKTTFIKEYASKLADMGERVAVIVNDYGAINVDRLMLEEELGDKCHLEMVIGGDPDCTRRRLKTKLIAAAMDRYTRVIVEPSGVFDIDDFFDMIYEEPLERWYEIGTVIAIVEAGIERDISEESRYLLSAQVSKAGTVVLSKYFSAIEKQNGLNKDSSQNDSEECDNQDGLSNYVNHMKTFLNNNLEKYKSNRKISDMFIWNPGDITAEDIKQIESSGYRSSDMIKLPVLEENDYDSLFFFNVSVSEDTLKNTISQIFSDNETGNVIRLKGYIKKASENDVDTVPGGWLEVNATKQDISIRPVSVGQELFIVIGEGLDQHKIKKYLE